MAFFATTGGYNADMTQSVMLACAEKRLEDVKILQAVEWFTNNSFCYTARETVSFAAALGIVSRFTPARSSKATAWLNLS